MKKIDLSRTISVLANLGVIAGIVFLGVELRQNNELLSAEARSTRLEIRLNEHLLPVFNRDMADVLIKHRHAEELTEYESLILSRYMEVQIVIFQNVYTETQRGLIDESSIPLEAWRASFSDKTFSLPGYWPNLRDHWETTKFGFDPEFVQWVDQTILDR